MSIHPFNNRSSRRQLRLESLESRVLMAADIQWNRLSVKLHDCWPLGSLILICHQCQQQSLLENACSSCGASGSARGSCWEFEKANGGGYGYFCDSCGNGYTHASCPHCNTNNAVTVSTFRIKKSKSEIALEKIGLYVLAILFLVIVIFFILANNS